VKSSEGMSPGDQRLGSETIPPPARKRPMLDNGQGEQDNIITSISTQLLPFAALPVPREHSKHCQRETTAGINTYHRSPAAGTIPPPSSASDTGTDESASQLRGLCPPRLSSTARVTGASTDVLRKENKALRQLRQQDQPLGQVYLQTHKVEEKVPHDLQREPTVHRNHMCPSGLALHHPAASTLLRYATRGCPVLSGKPWTREAMQAAIDRGPHISARSPEAIDQLHLEVQEKVRCGQARLVNWEDIRENPPEQLKISPISMAPHKSRKFRTILDLSFPIRLQS